MFYAQSTSAVISGPTRTANVERENGENNGGGGGGGPKERQTDRQTDGQTDRQTDSKKKKGRKKKKEKLDQPHCRNAILIQTLPNKTFEGTNTVHGGGG